MTIQENAKVLNCIKVGEGLFSITMLMPQISCISKSGQFVHIACGEGNLLRRPISICEADEKTMRIVFQVKGEGTKWLSNRKENDIIDVLGPIGHGYNMEKLGETPVFIGGGIGVPPMLNTMKNSLEYGAKPTAILGFRSENVVILEKEFNELGNVHIATDDGTYGTHGFVTDVLKQNIEQYTSVCACGPKMMLKAIAQIAEQANIPCQVSLEERMGCGIGACLVCACALKGEKEDEVKYGHVCKNGPVFDAKEVVW